MRRPLCLDPDGPIFEMALSALDVEAQPGLHVGGELRLAEVNLELSVMTHTTPFEDVR
jgi:hypothetical protein